MLRCRNDDSSEDEIEKVNNESYCDLVTYKPNLVDSTFATLVLGNTFTSASEFSMHMNQPFISKTSFNKGQKLVAQDVQQYADESMKEALESAQNNSIFSGDGRYPIRRNRVVALGIVDKKLFHHQEVYYELTSHIFETEAMCRDLKQISSYKDKVDSFVNDSDNKNLQLLED